MTLFKIVIIIVNCILPFVIACALWISSPSKNDFSIKPARNRMVVFVYCILVLLLAYTPATYWDGSDKGRYMYEFDHILFANVNDLSKDIGWHYFVKICHYLTWGVSEFYFIITAAIFSGAFYFYSKAEFGKQNIGYFLLLTMGMLGFGSYTNNVIRNGIAVAFCIYALIVNRKSLKIALPIIAYFIHGSVLIMIVAYIATMFLKSNKIPFAFWILCLALSFSSYDVSSFFQMFGLLDERVLEYTGEASNDTLDVYSKTGMFRWDFLLYSVFPLCIARSWVKKYNYHNAFYIHMVNVYLLCNALWLLVIRQAFCDRFAFLSWLMIPIITLYPLLKNDIRIPNPEKTVYQIVTIITGVNAGLALLTIIKL